MPDWYVPLTGPEATLERMAKVFTGPDLHVYADGDKYFVRSARFSALTKPVDVMVCADRMLPPALALLNLYVGVIGDVHAYGALWRDEHGNEHGMTAAMGTARVLAPYGLERFSRTDPNGVTLASRLLPLAERDPRVATALREIRSEDPGWSEIYVLMELVAGELKEDPAHRSKEWNPIASKGWSDSDTLSRLKQTANHHRHGDRKKHRLPAKPVTRAEARWVITDVLCRWLEEKLGDVSKG